MPISIDEFDAIDRRDHEPTNAERVLRYLVRNREKAFKASEIADATDVASNSIHPVLGRLEDRGLVRHKEEYWALGDVEAVRDAFAFHSIADFLDDELGPESREAWLSAASDRDTEDES